MRALLLSSAFALGLGAVACVEDPMVSNDADTETGDGDGDSGDGDGEPENLVVDLFNGTCGPTATWTSATVGLMPIAIPCDMVGLEANGWMVRYVEIMLGDVQLDKVISLVSGISAGSQIRGAYTLEGVADPHTLEFRADLLLVCGDSDGDCVGRFALATAEGIPDGALTEIDDLQLASGMESIAIAVPLSELQSLSEPSIVLIGERTEPDSEPTPEVLIVKPRLVLP
jgi:hypothetical protein